MGKRKTSARKRLPDDDARTIGERSRAPAVPDEDVQALPVRETLMPPDEDREPEAEREPRRHTVDDMGHALGVPRAPDDEVRSSTEILEDRDRYRWEQEE